MSLVTVTWYPHNSGGSVGLGFVRTWLDGSKDQGFFSWIINKSTIANHIKI